MFWKKKEQKLDLRLPAVKLGEMPVPPSVRIMRIASVRAWTYGLLAANGLFWLSAVLFYFVMVSRISVNPYVADGSSYGCMPATYTGQITPQPPKEEAPTAAPVTLEPMAPLVVGE